MCGPTKLLDLPESKLIEVFAQEFLTNLQCAGDDKFSIKLRHVSVSQIAVRRNTRNGVKMRVKPARKSLSVILPRLHIS